MKQDVPRAALKDKKALVSVSPTSTPSPTAAPRPSVRWAPNWRSPFSTRKPDACRAPGAGAGGGDLPTVGCRQARRAGSRLRACRTNVGAAGYPGAFHRLRPQGGLAGRTVELLFQRLLSGHGHLLPLLHPHGAPGGAADEGRRNHVRHELHGAQKVVPNYNLMDRSRRPGGGLPLPGLRAWPQKIRVHAISPGPLKTGPPRG